MESFITLVALWWNWHCGEWRAPGVLGWWQHWFVATPSALWQWEQWRRAGCNLRPQLSYYFFRRVGQGLARQAQSPPANGEQAAIWRNYTGEAQPQSAGGTA